MIENEEYSKIVAGSNRSFGIVFAVIFTLIAAYPLLDDEPIFIWAAGMAATFLVVAVLVPNLLSPLNRLWFRFSLLLAMIINPLVMFIIFVSTVIPTGLLLKLFGKDVLNLKLDSSTDSYWIQRDPPGPPPSSYEDQF
ncbi:MAG: hypothetical protein AAF525_08745 [Pseudomonadota bacterium]